MKTFTCPYEAATWVKTFTDNELQQERIYERIIRSKDSNGTYYFNSYDVFFLFNPMAN